MSSGCSIQQPSCYLRVRTKSIYLRFVSCVTMFTLTFPLGRFHTLLVISFVFLTCFSSTSCQRQLPLRHMETFDNGDPETPMFNVVVYNQTDDVFVGARNTLYQLNSDLVLNLKRDTGPVDDHPSCPPPPEDCTFKRTPTNNDNKVLLIRYYNGNNHVLIACGSVYQGRCFALPAKSIATNPAEIGDPDDNVSYIAGKKSVVAFFAPSPNGQLALYSANEYDDRPLNLTAPAVSSKIIKSRANGKKKNVFFQYSVHTDASVTKVDFTLPYKRNYKVEYIYGFTYGNFSYFVTVQSMNLNGDDFETRLARVCNNDPTFFSYTEVAINCKNGTEIYNRANAAYLGPAGTTLKRTLKLDQSDNVLYVAFGRTEPGHGSVVYPNYGSVVCSFPMSSIITGFTNAIRDCFQAEKRSKLLDMFRYPGREEVCQKNESAEIDDNFCHNTSQNIYIHGAGSIPGGIRIRTPHIITSLAVTVQNSKTVAFLGTKMGTFIKILLDRQKEQELYTYKIGDRMEKGDISIRPSWSFDRTKSNIYLLSGHKVVKFPIGSCAPYTSCGTCLTTEDPLSCHWCGSYCAHYDECETPALLQKNTCPPIINDFNPKTGPADGGTKITITGDNFGSAQTGEAAKLIVKVGDSTCSIVRWEQKRIECLTPPSNEPKQVKIYIETDDTTYTHGEYDIKGNITSQDVFSYEVPVIYSVIPTYGPASGGTNVTISGRNLDIGGVRKIYIAGIRCRFKGVRNNGRFLDCLTGEYGGYKKEVQNLQHSGPVILQIDNATVRTEEELNAFNITTVIPNQMQPQFQYLDDPVINKISPQKTTKSGGTILTVEGSYLNSVARPRLVVTGHLPNNGRPISLGNDCKVDNAEGTVMKCLIPSLGNDVNPTASAPLQTYMGFLMDGVKALKDLPKNNPEMSMLLYYPDPSLFSYKNEDNALEVVEDDPILVLKGMNLDLALRPEDINVTVSGIGPCAIIKILPETLRCRLLQSAVDKRNVDELYYSIKFEAGALTYDVGLMKFVDKPKSASSSTGPITAIVIPVFVIILLLVILFLYICYRRKWQKKQQMNWEVSFTADGRIDVPSNRTRQETNDYQTFNPGDRDNQQPLLTSHQAAQHQIDSETMQLLHAENILIAREYLSLEDVIGQGHFGCVHKGTLQLPGKEDIIHVAVKTLNNNALKMEQDAEAFLQEGLMMKDFHHHNVLTLIGVTFDTNNTPMVIIPYMANGDLLSYIRNENNSPTVKDLLQFGVQIAEGMKYLADLKFVHRDLAARNCMLDEELNVKVADFGLSRDIYEREYYSSDNKKTKLPVKWMAPESLEKGTYSSKTDVWSYGVLLWELMTRGVTPYPDVDNWDILHYLKQGRRMPQPSYCPDMLYRIMLLCWSEDPKKRPAFAELVDEVQGVITKLEQKSKQRRVGLDVTYVNYPPPDASSAECA